MEEMEKLKDYLNLKPKTSDIEKNLLSKTKTYFSLLRYIPGIKMVCVGNSVAMNGAKESSDIDLFIVCEKNMMWYVRTKLTLFFALLWVRKTKNKHAWRFCLSFFMTDSELSLQNIAIENDIYLYYWIATLKPIVNKDATYESFIQANNSWCDFSTFATILEENKKAVSWSGHDYFWNNFLLHKVNFLLKKILLPRTLASYAKLWFPSWVVINDDMLKFHDQDRRIQIRNSIFWKN